ncbi:MAG: hypothetical protein AB8H80_00685 [Planctomycetota bacterium]
MSTTKRTKKTGKRHTENEAGDEQALQNLPGGLKSLETIHDHNAKQILDLARDLVRSARTELGPDSSKPRIARVERLFEKCAGTPRRVPGNLDGELRRPEYVETIAQLDREWDLSFATARNAFDRISVASGSKIQDADDNWLLAVRIYESESRSAGAIFKAAVDKARAKTPTPHAEEDIDAHAEVAFHTRGSDISKALQTYEQAMAAATASLSTAFGALIKDLFDSMTATCVGEADLIQATQDASSKFWTGVHSQLSNKS